MEVLEREKNTDNECHDDLTLLFFKSIRKFCGKCHMSWQSYVATSLLYGVDYNENEILYLTTKYIPIC